MNRIIVTPRPAREDDTDDVLELTRTIWDGEDYVPKVWHEWLADRQGLLAVAEYQGVVVGLCKLTRLSQEDWWLEGMRVHPEHEGKGIASQLHDYLLDHWLEEGNGTVRMGTSSKRIPVHRIAARTGFKRIAEYTSYVADPVVKDPSKGSNDFRPLAVEDVSQALAMIYDSPSLDLCYGLMDLFWQWAPPRESFLLEAVEQGRAWWWRNKQGLLTEFISDEESEPKSYLQLLGCQVDDIPACLRDYRSFGYLRGYAQVGWMAPLRFETASLMEQAGYQRDWDSSLYIFGRGHPSGS